MSKRLTLYRTLLRLMLGWALLAAPRPTASAAPGDLDLTFAGFGTGGQVITTGVPTTYYYERDLALQPDGKIVVASQTGSSVLVMRYLPNGALDPAFSGDGIVTLSAAYPIGAKDIALQPDGKMVVAGYILSSPSDFMLARLTSTGALDVSFGSGGFVTTNFGSDNAGAGDLLIQPDGKIVACGRAASGSGDFAVARYTADGSLDATFSDDGKQTFGFGDADACHDLALLAGGDLVLAGEHWEAFPDSGADFALAWVKADGELDTSIDYDGKLTTGFGGTEWANAVAIQADGKIVAAGSDEDHMRVARYLSDGVLDDSFDGDGKLSIAAPNIAIYDLAIQADGKLVLLGSQDGQFTFYRLNPDSSLDTTFDGDGKRLLDLGSEDWGHALALQADGRLIAYGARGNDHALVRLWPDGTLDTGGQQVLDFVEATFDPRSSEAANALALQADGQLVVAGDLANAGATDRNFALARFLPDGRPDTTFGALGQVSFGFGAIEIARAVAVQADGKLVAAGSTGTGTGTNFMIARFNANGTPDPSFGFLGYRVYDLLDEDQAMAVALTPDNKVVVAGTSTTGGKSYFSVVRLNSNGELDNTLSGDGKVSFQYASGTSQSAYAVVVQPDLKIVVAGNFTGNFDDDFAITRLNPDGTPDLTFGPAGTAITNMGGFDSILALALTADGSLLAAGRVSYRGDTDFALARYTTNGALDPGFGASGKAYVDFGDYDAALAADVRADGAIAVAGYSGAVMAVAQLQPDGTLDPAFNGTGRATADFAGSEEKANAVKFVAPDTIVVAGYQTVNGETNLALARIETIVDAGSSSDRLFLPLVLH